LKMNGVMRIKRLLLNKKTWGQMKIALDIIAILAYLYLSDKMKG